MNSCTITTQQLVSKAPSYLMEGSMWTHDMAVAFCKLVEPFCSGLDFHVALTGGCLYKGGPRKDLDLVFYSVRQSETADPVLLMTLLAKELKLSGLEHYGWMFKAQYNGKKIDFLFPESPKNNTSHYVA